MLTWFVILTCERVPLYDSLFCLPFQEVKVSSPDYLAIDREHAVEDFKDRIAVYEKQYHSLDEELDKNLSFIEIYNQGERYLINNIHGMLHL